jgi:hypothetical protein
MISSQAGGSLGRASRAHGLCPDQGSRSSPSPRRELTVHHCNSLHARRPCNGPRRARGGLVRSPEVPSAMPRPTMVPTPSATVSQLRRQRARAAASPTRRAFAEIRSHASAGRGNLIAVLHSIRRVKGAC